MVLLESSSLLKLAALMDDDDEGLVYIMFNEMKNQDTEMKENERSVKTAKPLKANTRKTHIHQHNGMSFN